MQHLAPVPPPLPSISAYHTHASSHLPHLVFEYYDSGARDEQTLRDNIDAYQHILIRPRCCIDTTHIDTSCSIMNHRLPIPICIASTAMACMAHPDGEIAVARAAAQHQTIMSLSTYSTTSIEDVAASAPTASLFFQLYVFNDRTLTANLVNRAAQAGYQGLIVTIDTPIVGVREREVRATFTLPSHLVLANFQHPELRTFRKSPAGIKAKQSDVLGRSAALTWKDLAWLQSLTPLPVLVKGVLSVDDALLACESGCRGIIVSNHGGRQLDGVSATIEVIEDIVTAVRQWEKSHHEEKNKKQDPICVMMDGGIRSGRDVFKALALGADAVFIGRPVLWGLAYAGTEGVSQVLSLLTAELQHAMIVAGCTKIADINPRCIVSAESMRPRL